MKRPGILLASFPSHEAATKGINGYFYDTEITIADDGTLKRPEGRKPLPGHWTETKRGRVRFYCAE
jgi:hypothetical protein